LISVTPFNHLPIQKRVFTTSSLYKKKNPAKSALPRKKAEKPQLKTGPEWSGRPGQRRPSLDQTNLESLFKELFAIIREAEAG
jgi:hypothetical protein